VKIQQSGKLMWMFIDKVSILSGHRVTFIKIRSNKVKLLHITMGW
jgi:hypothetical protein